MSTLTDFNDTGHVRLKIVLLGDRAVGKSSIIQRFTTSQFNESIRVTLKPYSPQSVSTSQPSVLSVTRLTTKSNCGTQQAKKSIVRWSRAIWREQKLVFLYMIAMVRCCWLRYHQLQKSRRVDQDLWLDCHARLLQAHNCKQNRH